MGTKPCAFNKMFAITIEINLYVSLSTLMGFPGGAMVENLPANTGESRDVYSTPGESQGQRSPAGYSS